MNNLNVEVASYLTKSTARVVTARKSHKAKGLNVKHIEAGAQRRAERKVRSTMHRAAQVADWDDEFLVTPKSYNKRQQIK